MKKSKVKNILFPAIRRVFAGLNEIVSVQPMTAPSGLLFYQNYLYGFLGSFMSWISATVSKLGTKNVQPESKKFKDKTMGFRIIKRF